MAEPDDEAACYRCEQGDVETTTHTVHFFDERESKTVDLCPPCVRMVREADNPARSIT